MQRSYLHSLTTAISALAYLSACHSAPNRQAAPEAARLLNPSVAARHFFTSHFDFYYEDPSRFRTLLTPRFFQALKREYESVTTTGQVGALDCDPWTDSQDGNVSEPFVFETTKSEHSEETVCFKYTFTSGPKSFRNQFVLLKFQRTSPEANWKLADFITPNHKSLVELLERHP